MIQRNEFSCSTSTPDRSGVEAILASATAPADVTAAERNLLASVLAQTASVLAGPARAPSRSAAPRAGTGRLAPRGGWALPGFEGKCKVATNFGDLPIEALRRRDMVRTRSGAFRAVEWIDALRLDVDFVERHDQAQPVAIRARALGAGFPARTILVSPAQTLCLPGASQATTIRASDLLGRSGVYRAQRTELTYYRFHCGGDELVSIDGLWFPTGPDL